MAKSNFEFLKSTPYEPCLQHLEKFEQLFVLQPKEAGASLREFWEIFTGVALKENGLWGDYQVSLTEKSRDNLGNRFYFMRTCPQSRLFGNRRMDSALTYTYTDQNGKRQTLNRFEDDYRPKNDTLWLFDFFREYANAFHHSDGPSGPPYAVTFHHTLDYTTHVYQYLRSYLKLPNNNKAIDLRQLPLCINNEQTVFYIEDELLTGIDIPTKSGCYSYHGTMYPNKENAECYPVIIQLFDKQPELPRTVVERGHTTYNSTRRSKFGEALRDVRVLSGYNAAAHYYILVYVFEQPAYALAASELRDASMHDRLVLCREIAAIIRDLHNATPSIHHRLLNHNCVWLCRDIDGIALCPAIVGFSLAKINRENQATAVMPNTKKLVEDLRCTGIGQYIPAEWSNQASELGDKMDIYAMGILFTNILAAKFNLPLQTNEKSPITNCYPTIRLALQNAPKEAVNLIIEMLNPLSKLRPSADVVYDTLCNICQ